MEISFLTMRLRPARRFSSQSEKKAVGREAKILKNFQEKIMQTLTAGSFLNLENAENIEALKFTARRLAEMTTAVATAENLNAEALKNLANDLWQKADYVARETERRNLREIFVENFCEGFRELKPEISKAEITNVEVRQNISAASSNDWAVQQLPVTVESVSMPDLPQDDTTKAQEKKDEFLGFVKTEEPFVETPATETNAAATVAMPIVPETTEQEAIKAAPEDEPVADEKVSTENPNEIRSQSTAVAAPVANAKDNPPASAVKSNATAQKSADALKEPFEFGKCTVNLNLTLLPSTGDGRGRRAIVSAASHNLPPEIEFLEIGEGEDLTEIVALVSGKLERFKQTLPAKYIEQLRASKTKTAKKQATVKTQATVAAPTKPETVQTNGAKTNGRQQTQNLSATETEKTKAEITATEEKLTTQPAPVESLPQSQVAATNNVQPSLF